MWHHTQDTVETSILATWLCLAVMLLHKVTGVMKVMMMTTMMMHRIYDDALATERHHCMQYCAVVGQVKLG